MPEEKNLHLTSTWFIKPGCEGEALLALDKLAHDVHANEPDTLGYFVHRPRPGNHQLVSLPPADPSSILFFEIYRDVDAFLSHLNGPVFTGFVHEHGDLFVNSNGHPFTFVEFLELHAGFARSAIISRESEPATEHGSNHHPAVMFEIIARKQTDLKKFYSEVFGWHYQTGTGGFAYIHFETPSLPLLGGIGQTSSAPGFEPGRNFYLRVESLNDAINKALAAGGSLFVPPTEIDGYHFAMFKDPEGNPVGLIEPFV